MRRQETSLVRTKYSEKLLGAFLAMQLNTNLANLNVNSPFTSSILLGPPLHPCSVSYIHILHRSQVLYLLSCT